MKALHNNALHLTSAAFVRHAALAGERGCSAGLRWRQLVVVGLVLVIHFAREAQASDSVTAVEQGAIARVVRAHIGTGRSSDDQPIAEYPKFRRIVFGTGED